MSTANAPGVADNGVDNGFFSSIQDFLGNAAGIANSVRGLLPRSGNPADQSPLPPRNNSTFQGNPTTPTTSTVTTSSPSWLPYALIGGGLLVAILVLKK